MSEAPKLRILVFNYEYPPLGGGGGVIAQSLCEELSKRNEVTVVTSGHKSLPSRESRGNLAIRRVPVLLRTARDTATMVSMLSYFPSSLVFGYRLLSRQRFDVVNAHFVVPSGPSAQLLARTFRIPSIISVMGGDLFDPSKTLSPHKTPLVRPLVSRLLTRADRVVAASQNSVDNIRTFYGVERSIDFIPLGIPQFEIHRLSRQDLGLDDNQFVLVSVGRLVRRKNLQDLLEVVRDLDDPQIVLVIIGDGPERKSLERSAADLGIARQVQFTGRIGDAEKSAYLASGDLYASTSDHEGFGLVFLEAMHCGLPVVCYDFGGQTDFLDRSETGALVPHGDRASFVAAIRRFQGDAALLEGCREAVREKVAEYYVERCAQSYERLFLEVARPAAGPMVP